MSLPQPPVDPPEWLRTLPVAPEYSPTLAEFADPVAYILKIEPEASRYGICKIVPPLSPPPREATIQRLKASFASNAAASASAAGDDAAPAPAPTFPTRLQQVGLSTKNRRAANRRVWESGERYTLEAFRSKARDFEPPRHAAPPKGATPLQLEALFWGACAARPFNVEYGNDMPGSGFAAPGEPEPELQPEAGNAAAAPRDVGETGWNMRVAPRARGSLLQAMGRDVAGVTTPMLYVAMLYSWFAWHVEDHELHSLNYLHFGKPKTWYGVPRDAMLAFEDAVRVHGYADDLNAIVAFQTLNEKTTVLSPEVLLSAGVPCCRLVQNPGEFVITFPGAYHSGFSHGFNCGEATNIATPHWLQVAKEAAIRRASTNCGPMVSHYQLLYKLALSLRPRELKDFYSVPRSSRLRDKKKNESDMMIKENFVGTVTETNNLLSILLDKGSCIIVPEIAFPIPSFSIMMEPKVTLKQCLTTGPYSHQQAVEDMHVDVLVDKVTGIEDTGGSQSASVSSFSVLNRRKLYQTKCGKLDTAAFCLSTSEIKSGKPDKDQSHLGGGLLDKGRLPCVQCGILSFACVAIIQPKEAAVQYMMSRECVSSSAKHEEIGKSDCISKWITENHEIVPQQGQASGADDNVMCGMSLAQVSDRCRQLYRSDTNGCASALGLLASAYDTSDSEEETADSVSTNNEKNDAAIQGMDTTQPSRLADTIHFTGVGEPGTSYERIPAYVDSIDDLTKSGVKVSSDTCISTSKASMGPNVLTLLKYNKDYCRMHVFCLEHALETWTQLQQIGGANIMLLCHPEYPRAESAAKVMAKELGMKHDWKEITFEEATKGDIRTIQLALQDEDAEPTSSDWAVKMGINIYYSAKQSKSPLYSKQIPYNSIIYRAFGQESLDNLTDYGGQRSGTIKKKVAGWWCGKVWMSNQVHPLLTLEHEQQNFDIGYSKPISSANSHDKIQEELSTKCPTMVNQSPPKRVSGRKKGDPAEKSRTKKKRCNASDEPTLHCSGLEMNSEATYDHHRKSDDHDKFVDGNEIEEAPKTQNYQQHNLQNMKKKTSSKKQKDDKRNTTNHEPCNEDNDVNSWLNLDFDDTTIGNRGNSPQRELDAVKVKSGGKLLGTKRKANKDKASDDLSNGINKLQKMNKKSSSKKHKNAKVNPQFGEDHNKDNSSGYLLNVEGGDEAALDSWEDKIPEEKTDDAKVKSRGKMQSSKRKTSKRQASDGLRTRDKEPKFSCDIEGCDMSFSTQQDLQLHKRDICPVKGCRKKFFCHKYLLQHRKVHIDERPLKCSWKGCKKTFKWPWARTEHMRVHTGVRPYACKEPGCTQTFRFVSDFSRHKRKTGHSCDKKKKSGT